MRLLRGRGCLSYSTKVVKDKCVRGVESSSNAFASSKGGPLDLRSRCLAGANDGVWLSTAGHQPT